MLENSATFVAIVLASLMRFGISVAVGGLMLRRCCFGLRMEFIQTFMGCLTPSLKLVQLLDAIDHPYVQWKFHVVSS